MHAFLALFESLSTKDRRLIGRASSASAAATAETRSFSDGKMSRRARAPVCGRQVQLLGTSDVGAAGAPPSSLA